MLPGSMVRTVAGPPGGVSTVTRPPRRTVQVFGQVWLRVMANGVPDAEGHGTAGAGDVRPGAVADVVQRVAAGDADAQGVDVEGVDDAVLDDVAAVERVAGAADAGARRWWGRSRRRTGRGW